MGVGAVVGDVVVFEELLEGAIFAIAAVEGEEEEGILIFGELEEFIEGILVGGGRVEI